MNVQAHVETLTRKHAEIESIIAQENARPNPDLVRISELKRRKLDLKDKLSQLQHH